MNKLYMGRSRSKAKAKAKKYSHRNKKRALRKLYRQHGGGAVSDIVKMLLRIALAQGLLASTANITLPPQFTTSVVNAAGGIVGAITAVGGGAGSVSATTASLVYEMSVNFASAVLSAGANSSVAMVDAAGSFLSAAADLAIAAGLGTRQVLAANGLTALMELRRFMNSQAEKAPDDKLPAQIARATDAFYSGIQDQYRSAIGSVQQRATAASQSAQMSAMSGLIFTGATIDQYTRRTQSMSARVVGKLTAAGMSVAERAANIENTIEAAGNAFAPVDDALSRSADMLGVFLRDGFTLGVRAGAACARGAASAAAAAASSACRVINGLQSIGGVALQIFLAVPPQLRDDAPPAPVNVDDVDVVIEAPPVAAPPPSPAASQESQGTIDAEMEMHSQSAPVMVVPVNNLAAEAQEVMQSRPPTALDILAGAAARTPGIVTPAGNAMVRSQTPGEQLGDAAAAASLMDLAVPPPPPAPVNVDDDDDDSDNEGTPINPSDSKRQKTSGGRRHTKKHRKHKTHKRKNKKHKKSHKKHKKSKRH